MQLACRPGRIVSRVRVYRILAITACLLAQPVLAAPQAANVDAGAALLQKVQTAARDLDYSGVYIYQQGDMVASSRIVHIVDGTGERERIETLDGLPREFIRNNDMTQCLIPEKKLIILEHQRGDRFPSLLLGDGKNLTANYVIKMGAVPSRIAGRSCTMVELTPKDTYRYGYRICADSKTNLLLKAQTLSNDRSVIDQISFTSVQIGDKVVPEELATGWNTQGWKVHQAPMSTIDLPKAGWRIPFPAGFQTITQVSRTLQGGAKVSQLVASDGMVAVSVFIEPYDAADASPLSKGAMHRGAMNVFRTRIGSYWLTALGEVPAETLRNIAEQTEHVPPASHQ
ncbi:MucB/RseB C-terminal domain-containing protein [Alcaligenaceae bacterium]|nr:MucB/RseB C-terminal domain-containing protein [Alcaligenaceae bacterium]